MTYPQTFFSQCIAFLGNGVGFDTSGYFCMSFLALTTLALMKMFLISVD
jgi:hypothetical protein